MYPVIPVVLQRGGLHGGAEKRGPAPRAAHNIYGVQIKVVATAAAGCQPRGEGAPNSGINWECVLEMIFRVR
jgi:hypothetical protein